MTKEQINENPIYVAIEEEDEEEEFTLDFDKNIAYQLNSEVEVLSVTPPVEVTQSIEQPSPIPKNDLTQTPDQPSFKEEMNNLLLNTITSKAIASLLRKRMDLDLEIGKVVNQQRMGELNTILSEEFNEILDRKRMELRKCYIGSQVKYENIPDWAKSYIKDYTQEMIHGLSILIDN